MSWAKLSMEVTRLLPMLKAVVEKRIHSSGQGSQMVERNCREARPNIWDVQGEADGTRRQADHRRSEWDEVRKVRQRVETDAPIFLCEGRGSVRCRWRRGEVVKW